MARDERWYLLVDGGEFIGSFIVYSAPTREQVEAYRDALLVKRGVYRSGPGMPLEQVWGPGVDIVNDNCWFAYWPETLRRWKAAQQISEQEGGDGA